MSLLHAGGAHTTGAGLHRQTGASSKKASAIGIMRAQARSSPRRYKEAAITPGPHPAVDFDPGALKLDFEVQET